MEPKPNFTEICPTPPTNKGSLNYNYNCFFIFGKVEDIIKRSALYDSRKKCGLVVFAKKVSFYIFFFAVFIVNHAT